MPEAQHKDIHWYAARMNGIESAVDRRLALDGIRTYRTRFASGILFLQCPPEYVTGLISFFWGHIYFYLNAERRHPAEIPDSQMSNFILVTSASDDLIPLGQVSEEFLKGDRVRVKAGIFEGAEGVIKRIKGDRRLIVSIDGFTAVATCYIKPEFLEKVKERAECS